MNHEDDHFPHEREFACVSEDILKESLTKDVSFPFRIFTARKQASSQFFVQVLLLAVRYSQCVQTA
jgi:hypothetical protein